MPVRVTDRHEVRRLAESGAQLVEVLPREEYEDLHLPGAVHLWLRDLDREAARKVDTEGRSAAALSAGDVAQRAVLTCRADQPVAEMLAQCVMRGRPCAWW